jgi:hypothetical protein
VVNALSLAIPLNSPEMNNSDASFTPAELRKLRNLKDPHGIQKYLNAQPYHLADTAWSPRHVLRENTSHCFEAALFAAAALRVNGYPPLIIDLEAEHDSDHARALGINCEFELHRLPISRAGVSHAARTGDELF